MQKIINTYQKIPNSLLSVQDEIIDNSSTDVKESGHLELLTAQIGDFHIIEILCETSTSTLCVANYNNVLYTLKVARTQPYFQEMMLQEINRLEQIQSLEVTPKLIKVQTSLPVFLAYKFQPISLSKALEINHGGFPMEIVKQFGLQLIHLTKKLPFIHQDICLDNILINDNMELLLIDFNSSPDDDNLPYQKFLNDSFDPTNWQIGAVLMGLFLGHKVFTGGVLSSLKTQFILFQQPVFEQFSLGSVRKLFESKSGGSKFEQQFKLRGWKLIPNIDILNAESQYDEQFLAGKDVVADTFGPLSVFLQKVMQCENSDLASELEEISD